jgi:hypothetical protein
MEFRIAKAELLCGLRLAQSIAARKSTMPRHGSDRHAGGAGQPVAADTIRRRLRDLAKRMPAAAPTHVTLPRPRSATFATAT